MQFSDFNNQLFVTIFKIIVTNFPKWELINKNMTIIFIILAAVCNSVMDVLSTRYYVSIFGNLKNRQFWDWNMSWRNKWQWGEKENGEKFFLSSTMLSFLTDGWHLFKALMLLFISLAIVTYKPIFGYFDIILFSIIWGVVFEICYTKLLLK
jgi:hypothetical protein